MNDYQRRRQNAYLINKNIQATLIVPGYSFTNSYVRVLASGMVRANILLNPVVATPVPPTDVPEGWTPGSPVDQSENTPNVGTMVLFNGRAAKVTRHLKSGVVKVKRVIDGKVLLAMPADLKAPAKLIIRDYSPGDTVAAMNGKGWVKATYIKRLAPGKYKVLVNDKPMETKLIRRRK